MPNKTGPSRGPDVGCLGLAFVGLIILVLIGLSVSWRIPSPPEGGSGSCEWERVKTSKNNYTHTLAVGVNFGLPLKPKPPGGGSGGARKARPEANRPPGTHEAPKVPQRPTQRPPEGYVWKLDCD